MGIVLKQSLKNTIVTYLGFAIGAINTLFLYTSFMKEEYYGLIQVILSISAVLMPLMAFGVPNTLVKFYSVFKEGKSKESFLTLMLLLPLLFIIPIALISFFATDVIGNILSTKNPIVKDYVWYIFLTGMAMAYFEIFFAWAKIQMKSVFGNFMKEIFCRVGQTILLLLLWKKVITIDIFIKALVGFYILRTVIMKIYAYKLRMPKLMFSLPKNTKDILKYSTLIILGGSTAIVLLEVDKVMLNNFLEIENVAYYAVAGFIATTIAVPSRAMHQITYPITATYINAKNYISLKELYQKSSLTLFIISGLLFLLIIINIKDIYSFLPEAYSNGYLIVFWIGLAKVYDALLGNNNSILFNSDYYRSVLFLGVLLAVLAVGFNFWLIPKFGIKGAAIASFSAFFVYNSLKLLYVKAKFKIQPFTIETLKILGLLISVGFVFYYMPLTFPPILAILVKSSLALILYIGILYKLSISRDVNVLIDSVINKIIK
ncbi:polysaccharide biosynthesis C-terminal domain-containing protein [uncultured Maribacter sp.]|uniref:lipopolysaccharide biosynthesis protein n=1 Tax=uncultured Maribacter sp. TaxID=431308 RepID=UPI002603E43A|nr:polysaccharide biosynthesis C-terminal domain-containing protein [uncultured Maribacter sp.]